MQALVPPTPPDSLLQASWSLGEHELFSLRAPSFDARCNVSGFESHMKLVVPQDCSVELVQQDAVVRLSPGQVGILPLTSTFHIGTSVANDGWGQMFQWRLPTDVLTRRHAHLQVSQLRIVRGTSAPERLLTRLLGGLADELSNLSREQVRTTLSALIEALGLLAPMGLTDADDKRIGWALNYIHVHLHSPQLDAHEVATAQGVSRRYLDAVFKRKQERSVSEAIRVLRLERAVQILRSEPDTAVLPLAISLGFENASHFARRFKEYTQLSPSEFRAKLAKRTLTSHDLPT